MEPRQTRESVANKKLRSKRLLNETKATMKELHYMKAIVEKCYNTRIMFQQQIYTKTSKCKHKYCLRL